MTDCKPDQQVVCAGQLGELTEAIRGMSVVHKQAVDTLSKSVERVDETVRDHGKAINGTNGTPGLKTRVAQNEQNWNLVKWVITGVSTFVGAIAVKIFYPDA